MMIKIILLLLLLFLLPTQLGTFFFIPDSIIHGIPIDLLAPALYATDILVIILVILNLFYDPHLIKKIKKLQGTSYLILPSMLLWNGNESTTYSHLCLLYLIHKCI